MKKISRLIEYCFEGRLTSNKLYILNKEECEIDICIHEKENKKQVKNIYKITKIKREE